MSEARQEQTAPSESERRPPPGALNGAGDDATADHAADDQPPAAPSWREDWRTALAGGDEKKARQLERYVTPEAFAKASFDAQNRIRSGRAVEPEPPEEATDAELADWRKRIGIPETPAGYEIDFPKEIEPSERDKTELSSFLQFMHDKNVAPRAAKAAFDFYMTTRAAAAEETARAAEEATLDNLADLRKTYPGREYKRNIGLANDFINDHFAGPDAQAQLDTILDARLPNGVQLTNYAPFVHMIVAMARAAASEDDLISGDAGGGARSVDEEYMELAKKPRLTEDERSRMTQLAEARIKRDERAAAR